MIDFYAIHYKIGDKEILKDVSLSLTKNDHILIHGASGCGKSTLMHIMAGLLKPTSGSLHFDGQDYNDLSTPELDTLRNQNFGFIFQKIHLINHLTARQNIQISSSHEINMDIINDLGIIDILDQKASSLSVGEAQRVALVRALSNKPSIVFADEPTSALDKKNADSVIDMLFTQAKKNNFSLVITSHDERIQSRFDNKLGLSHE
jgi:putative ABC transport system ATP-binding protein